MFWVEAVEKLNHFLVEHGGNPPHTLVNHWKSWENIITQHWETAMLL